MTSTGFILINHQNAVGWSRARYQSMTNVSDSEVPEWVRQSKVGDKVVCIDCKPRGNDTTSYLEVGKTYTLRGVIIWSNWVGGTKPPGTAFFLKEVNRPACSTDGLEHPYGWDRFKPLTRKKTDISVLENILLNSHIEIPEDA